jgi:CO/xanthine dehydrogenase FAD-binding subunit
LADASRARTVDLVVDLTGIEELRAIGASETRETAGEEHLVLGGGVTYWVLRTDARIGSAIPMLARMAQDVGAVQIQTRGTLAGNLASASPAADGVPALMALEATLTLRSVRGERKVETAAFFTGYRKTVLEPDELITSIDLRVPPPGSWARWQKVGTRLAQAISKVALASVVTIEGGAVVRARFGMASVGPTTARLPAVSAAVTGKTLAGLDRRAVDAAVEQDIKPIDDVRSTAAYRLHVAKALVWRALCP